ncbi:hypothetical protein IPH67_03945 [bacterium]|nr:MAG: hypothetical protein IPH67_03945 [bacterium]
MAKNQSESDYSKALSGESDLLKIHDYDGAIPLSFGERLLDNIVYDIGACPWYYMKIHNRGFAIPVEKENL